MPAVYRAAFIAIFGKKKYIARKSTKLGPISVTVAGTKNQPCMIQKGKTNNIAEGVNPYQYLTGKDRESGEMRYVESLEKGLQFRVVPPPAGLKWIWDEDGKKRQEFVKVTARYIYCQILCNVYSVCVSVGFCGFLWLCVGICVLCLYLCVCVCVTFASLFKSRCLLFKQRQVYTFVCVCGN